MLDPISINHFWYAGQFDCQNTKKHKRFCFDYKVLNKILVIRWPILAFSIQFPLRNIQVTFFITSGIGKLSLLCILPDLLATTLHHNSDCKPRATVLLNLVPFSVSMRHSSVLCNQQTFHNHRIHRGDWFYNSWHSNTAHVNNVVGTSHMKSNCVICPS